MNVYANFEAILKAHNEQYPILTERMSDVYAEQEAIKSWRKKEADIIDQFKQACFEYYGIAKSPKRELAWNMAWEEGHGNGLAEVEIYLSKYSELIR